jgi:DNA-binding MarR family transcriptional regulator
VIDGIAHTVQTVFLIGVPIAFVAFLLSWTLPELELRKSIRASEPAQGIGLQEPRTSLGEIQRILERAASRENRSELYQTLASRADIDLDPRGVWMLYRLADRPDCTLEELGARLKVEPQRLEGGIDSLVSAGMLERTDGTGGCDLELTGPGHRAIDRLTEARRDSMTELLEGWDPEAHPEVLDLVRQLAKSLLADDDRLLAEATATRT